MSSENYSAFFFCQTVTEWLASSIVFGAPQRVSAIASRCAAVHGGNNAGARLAEMNHRTDGGAVERLRTTEVEEWRRREREQHVPPPTTPFRHRLPLPPPRRPGSHASRRLPELNHSLDYRGGGGNLKINFPITCVRQ